MLDSAIADPQMEGVIDPLTLGRRIRALRLDGAITLAQLTESVGVSA